MNLMPKRNQGSWINCDAFECKWNEQGFCVSDGIDIVTDTYMGRYLQSCDTYKEDIEDGI